MGLGITLDPSPNDLAVSPSLRPSLSLSLILSLILTLSLALSPSPSLGLRCRLGFVLVRVIIVSRSTQRRPMLTKTTPMLTQWPHVNRDQAHRQGHG